MAIFDITAFAGTTIVTAERVMDSMVESHVAVTRMGQLENGAIFDADGTADADTSLGTVTARYKLRPSTRGVTAVNTLIDGLKALQGKHGTLTGIERSASPVTKTCTARCLSVTQEEISTHNAPPMHAKYYQRVYVTIVWQKKTEWAS